MKKLIGLLLAFGLITSSLASVTAQEAATAFGDGINSPATWFDDRGNAMASLEVTELIEDWSEYEENREPARGYLYYAVVMNVTNVASDDIEINPRSFSMTDSLGLNLSRANTTAAEGASRAVFADTVSLASGESTELMLVYELFSDVSPALLVWEADRSQVVLIGFSDDSLESSAVATGLNSPATSADDRGNEFASIEVTGITDDWQDHDPNRQADRGSRYVAVDFSITNLSDTEIPVTVHNLSLIDAEGAVNGTSNTQAAEGSGTVVFSSNEDIAPGETLEGTLIFQLFTGVDPVGLMWQPQSGMMNVVILDEGTDVADEMEATPEDVIEATPAA